MNDLNSNTTISSLKHLSSESVVSLELVSPLETSFEDINEIEYLDAEAQRADVLLEEMMEIRQILQSYLQDLFTICN